MSVISKRAAARHIAVSEELRGKYPTLLKRPQTLARPDRTAIALGRNKTGSAVLVPERAFLEHAHAIGTTGSGKTTCIAHASRQAIANGCGVLIVDPHGEHPDSLYRSQLAWLDHGGYLARRTVHLIDPNAPTHTIGFNPLARPDAETDLSVVAGVTLEAFSRAWGGEDTATKPTIERVLTATFSALAELNLTLVEAPMLLDRKDRHGLRAYAIEHVTDRYTRDELQRLHELSLDERRRHDFDLEVVGPINRLARFVRPSAIRGMIGQTEHTLDLREAMDEGHVILCNLSGGARVYETDADLLGRLLTRTLFFHAKRRRHPERPFFVFLDECHRYLSGDLENILAEARKYGIAVFLAHQWLEQLRVEGDNMLAAVQSATNVKLVFRVKDAKEAEELAASVVPLDLERPVQVLVKPTVVGHRLAKLKGESVSDQFAVSEMRTDTEGRSVTESYGYAESTSETLGESISDAESQALSITDGVSNANVIGTGNGFSTTIMTTPNGEFFASPNLAGISQGDSTQSNASRSFGTNSAQGRSSTSSSSRTSSKATTTASSWSESVAYTTSSATSIGRGVTHGKAQTQGTQEAFESVYENRPSAVHGKDAMLYMAAQTLRNLKTGQAYVNFVGANGMEFALLSVPRVAEHKLSAECFAALRERVLAQSSAALPLADAIAGIAAREQRMLEQAPSLDDFEPESFRTKAPPTVPKPGQTPPDATGRGHTRSSSKQKVSG